MPTKMSRSDLLNEARTIAEEYRDAGYSLTLRQAYYQCVARGLIPNSQESYKRLGDVLGDARLKGDFEMDLIVDRGRSAGGSKHVECKLDVDEASSEAGEYVRSIPHWTIMTDKWFGQSTYVSCWVEKEALAGVFETPCEDLGVGFFACKGYPSHSALWEWILKFQAAYEASTKPITDELGNSYQPNRMQEAVILYSGDHDPDGWQIPRSALETLRTLIDVQGLTLPRVRLERIALNMDQIRQYNPPPFPAKESSSRYASYCQEHGITDAWELDALDPPVLEALIRQHVQRFWSDHDQQEWLDRVAISRKRLQAEMLKPAWIKTALK